ncbi:MAG: M23 family metallopeptidase [Candidatus Peribacteraceae bacterium]|nr:M23 family metallopeptidase [Candidatus Peribacteraceae bacterium]
MIAFLVGNMVGQHGWYVFWRSVWGEGSDAYIVFTGTVTPIEKVPDYVRWAQQYGGDPHEHTYSQVPQDLLVELPPYVPALQSQHMALSAIGQIYSVGHSGAYGTGGDMDGSHPGIDIRVPVGTPVRAIANGIVESVGTDAGGYGRYVVIRHPNVPDPSDPASTTTLYSAYAHLSSVYVEEGAVVQKGERIALSGRTGTASGPHLHFQMDRDDAPWHPYWPFTTSEARTAGYATFDQAVNAGFGRERVLAYTVNPMLYVQAGYAPSTLVASTDAEQSSASSSASVKQAAPTLGTYISRLQSRVAERARLRAVRSRFSVVSGGVPVSVPSEEQSEEQSPAADPVPVVASRETVVSADAGQLPSSGGKYPIASVRISHDGSFAGRGWETVAVELLDADGRRVVSPAWAQDLFLRTVYGEAEFRPSILKEQNFVDGRATVKMLPRGRRTIVIQIQPLGIMSTPMAYK